ncbi:diiron oxygenase [Gordonia sp. X0973]|uniref:AurF N-oxygenase family protein n=1 Tax=Gordonia sp. X0973 TaxID=2742602 RepID=UPI000F546684|nr:diiron oxygenase [Gordonia sp. X0973]QKT05834.1 diiron oxygenase [Gordonia sp. X0973]
MTVVNDRRDASTKTAYDGDARTAIASRLLKGSSSRSFDPIVELDWEAPLEEGKYFLPPHVISLYGTDLWNAMTEEERIELSRQEMAHVLSVGIWFENLLNRALLLRLMREDPAAATSHYELTEMGDECRHMTMFGKVIERSGARPYMMRPVDRAAMYALPLVMRGTMLWVITLVGEELFDALQREMRTDPQLQPIVARLMQIHVTEEARHIGFARDGVMRRKPIRGRFETLVAANLHGLGGPVFRRLFTNPQMYKRAGIADPRQAARIARANPYFHETTVKAFAPLASFLRQADLMGPLGERLWRRSGFLP